MQSVLPTTMTFDDIREGARYVLGQHEMTREAVIDFATKFDPQPFHLDDAAAAAHPVFGRLAASGWHTALVAHLLALKLWQGTQIRGSAGLGADAIRWHAPVYPGDVLSGDIEIVTARPSASRPDRGVIAFDATLRNQHDTVVCTLRLTGFFER